MMAKTIYYQDAQKRSDRTIYAHPRPFDGHADGDAIQLTHTAHGEYSADVAASDATVFALFDGASRENDDWLGDREPVVLADTKVLVLSTNGSS